MNCFDINRRVYVVGFAFDPTRRWVVLIKKSKPAWMKDRLNGVGGKVEACDPTPEDAMVREFHEEAGVKTLRTDWLRYATVQTPQSIVHVLTATLSGAEFRACAAPAGSDETICQVDVERFAWWDHAPRSSYAGYLPNLRWLIPLATRASDLEYPVDVLTRTEEG